MLEGPKIILKTCHNLNPTSFLPEQKEKSIHFCEEVLMENYTSRPDLSDHPIDNPNLTPHIDESSLMIDGIQSSGYAVVTDLGVFLNQSHFLLIPVLIWHN